MISRKTYRALMALLDEPAGLWTDAYILGKKLNYTVKQVATAMQFAREETDLIERSGSDYRFIGTEEERKELRRRVTCQVYGITGDDMDAVKAVLEEGSCSAQHICDVTGFKRDKVYVILREMGVGSNLHKKCAVYSLERKEKGRVAPCFRPSWGSCCRRPNG